MEKRLHNLPSFNREAFETVTAGWKNLSSGPGSSRLVIEWSVQTGARCFVYPAAKRTAGVNLLSTLGVKDTDERYADWLEFDYVPQVVDAASTLGLNPQVICVDLRPVQTQRVRRRELASSALAKVAMGGKVVAH